MCCGQCMHALLWCLPMHLGPLGAVGLLPTCHDQAAGLSLETDASFMTVNSRCWQLHMTWKRPGKSGVVMTARRRFM